MSMPLSQKDAYSVVFKEYPDVVSVSQMSQMLGISEKSAYRTLPLVEPFENLLYRLWNEQQTNQKVCGAAYCKDYLDYIYVNAIGELVKPNFLIQHFGIVLQNNDLKKIRFHDLRHPNVKPKTQIFRNIF